MFLPSNSTWPSLLPALRTNKYVQLAVSLVALAAALWFFRGKLGYFRDGVKELRDASVGPLMLAVVSAVLTLVAMGLVMHTLLTGAGVKVRRRDTVALTFIGNSWATTFPGGGALSAAYQYSIQRSWGASRLVCGWFILFSGTLSNVWLAGLGIAAIVLTGASLSLTSLLGTLAVLVTLSVAVFVASRLHPKLSDVRLSVPQFLVAAVFSLANRLFDVATLSLCLWSVDATPSLFGVLLAYASAKIVGTIPVTPGGLGPVEAAMAAAFVSTGVEATTTAGAVVAYRIVSFLLMTLAGWIIYIPKSWGMCSRTQP